MSTINDHLRNLLDEIPGVNARDFIKHWNREARQIAQERMWRWLKVQYDFTIGDSFDLYETGTVTATYAANTVVGSATVWDTDWANSVKISISGVVYDVQTISSTTQLGIRPAYKGSTGSGKTYQLYYVPSAKLPPDAMAINRVAQLDGSRNETAMSNPLDYTVSEFYNEGDDSLAYPMIQFRDSGYAGDYTLYYWRWPTTLTSPATDIDLPENVQDVIYNRLVMYYISRANLDPKRIQIMLQQVQGRVDRALRNARYQDEVQSKYQGNNERPIWIPRSLTKV